MSLSPYLVFLSGDSQVMRWSSWSIPKLQDDAEELEQRSEFYISHMTFGWTSLAPGPRGLVIDVIDSESNRNMMRYVISLVLVRFWFGAKLSPQRISKSVEYHKPHEGCMANLGQNQSSFLCSQSWVQNHPKFHGVSVQGFRRAAGAQHPILPFVKTGLNLNHTEQPWESLGSAGESWSWIRRKNMGESRIGSCRFGFMWLDTATICCFGKVKTKHQILRQKLPLGHRRSETVLWWHVQDLNTEPPKRGRSASVQRRLRFWISFHVSSKCRNRSLLTRSIDADDV